MRGSLRFGSSVEATYGFYITATSSTYLLSQKAPSQTFGWILNTRLYYVIPFKNIYRLREK